LYHQDVPYIVIKLSLDKTDDDRRKIATLLHRLNSDEIITRLQMAQGFRKLYNQLHDLILDTPNAKVLIQEYLRHAVIAGYVEKEVASSLEESVVDDYHQSDVVKTKDLLRACLEEYFESADVKECQNTIKLVPPQFHFEVVKLAVSMSLDRGDRERELSSTLLAEISGSTISTDVVVKGFTVLLERVEDLTLDVPDVQRLLACFLARAVVDEALPPAFMVRMDLDGQDMGSQVVATAQAFCQQKGAAERLAGVWGKITRQMSQEPEDEPRSPANA